MLIDLDQKIEPRPLREGHGELCFKTVESISGRVRWEIEGQ